MVWYKKHWSENSEIWIFASLGLLFFPLTSKLGNRNDLSHSTQVFIAKGFYIFKTKSSFLNVIQSHNAHSHLRFKALKFSTVFLGVS